MLSTHAVKTHLPILALIEMRVSTLTDVGLNLYTELNLYTVSADAR
jgi:hypothetical protein